MFARVASRYRSWVDNSLANRFSAAAMALAGTAVLTLSIITYAAIGSLLSDRIYARIEAQSGYVASGFRFQLENLVKSSRDLASRTLVRTALADTEGRRAYLEPFIGEFRDSLPGIWAVEVVDFRGRALIRSGEAPLVDSDRTVAARVADSGTSEALLLRRGTHAHLLLVHPVIYEPTGTSEGAVLVEIDPALAANPVVDLPAEDRSVNVPLELVLEPHDEATRLCAPRRCRREKRRRGVSLLKIFRDDRGRGDGDLAACRRFVDKHRHPPGGIANGEFRAVPPGRGLLKARGKTLLSENEPHHPR